MPKMEIEEDEERAVSRKPARRRSEEEFEDRSPRRRDDDDDQPRQEEDFGDDDEMEEVAERRGRRSPRGSRGEWLRVRSGVGYFLAAAYTFVGSILVVFCGSFVVAAAGAGAAGGGGGGRPNFQAAGAMGAGFVALMVIYLGGFLATLVLQLVGQIFCLAAPEYRGARTLAKLSLGLYVTYLAAQVANWVVSFAGAGLAGANPMGMGAASGLSMVVSIIGGLVSLAYAGVLVFLLRSLALALREEGLARNAIYFFIYFIVCFVFLILGIVVFVMAMAKGLGDAAAGQGPGNMMAGMGIGVVLICLDLLLFLGLLIWYIITLSMTRGAITRATRRH
jgi:hypothetical protein